MLLFLETAVANLIKYIYITLTWGAAGRIAESLMYDGVAILYAAAPAPQKVLSANFF